MRRGGGYVLCTYIYLHTLYPYPHRVKTKRLRRKLCKALFVLSGESCKNF